MEKRNKKNEIRWKWRSQSLSVFLFSFFFFLFPVVTFAITFPPDLKGFVALFFTTFRLLIPILISIAFLAFFWGVAKFILSAGNEKEIAAGRQFMIWGVAGLFVLVTLLGILQFLSNQFEFGKLSFPFLPTSGGGTNNGSTFIPCASETTPGCEPR